MVTEVANVECESAATPLLSPTRWRCRSNSGSRNCGDLLVLRRFAAGVLDQIYVEEELYAAAEANGLVTDDGARQCWATIRSGLGAGLQETIDLDAG